MMVFFLLYLLAGCALSLLLLYLISLRKVYSVKGKHVLVSLSQISREITSETDWKSYNSLCFQITGGSSGIGKALAAEALKRGASSVTIVARNEVRYSSSSSEKACMCLRGGGSTVFLLQSCICHTLRCNQHSC